jgi:dsDNA-specific endonuclease/ATPase MutS2
VTERKTLALKSFGLAAFMCKAAIPIPSSVSKGIPRSSRVDFFSDILVDIGDQQNIMEGESTLMARLHSGAEIIRSVLHSNEDSGRLIFILCFMQYLYLFKSLIYRVLALLGFHDQKKAIILQSIL